MSKTESLERLNQLYAELSRLKEIINKNNRLKAPEMTYTGTFKHLERMEFEPVFRADKGIVSYISKCRGVEIMRESREVISRYAPMVKPQILMELKEQRMVE